jgi:spermidine/putrescine transport system ATP-binding protein/putrescine transport system ATP-binding protein
MVGGFETPDSGNVFIDGVEVTELPPDKRPTNMVFQSYAIFPHLDVFNNVAYGLRKARLPAAELSKRVDDALSMMRLAGMGGRKANELSGGQRQRVALARALVRRPKVLLLDEPLGALDKRLREAMQTELRQLQKDVGITFLFVTHDQEEALSMADRVAVMSAGRVLQVANPRELYEQPNCREVADFIGTMNFFDGVVVGTEHGSMTIDADTLGRIAVQRPANASIGGKVLIALRPEKLTISENGPLRGTISSITYLGERSHGQVTVDGLTRPIHISVINGTETSRALRSGDPVRLSWDANAVILLDR